jgi:hypothetical protein
LKAKQLSEAKTNRSAGCTTNICLVIYVLVEVSTPVHHTNATGHQKGDWAGKGDYLKRDPTASGENIGVLLGTEAGSRDLEFAGGVIASEFHAETLAEEDPEPTTQRDADFLLKLFSTRRLHELGGRNVDADVRSYADPLGYYGLSRSHQHRYADTQCTGHGRFATH